MCGARVVRELDQARRARRHHVCQAAGALRAVEQKRPHRWLVREDGAAKRADLAEGKRHLLHVLALRGERLAQAVHLRAQLVDDRAIALLSETRPRAGVRGWPPSPDARTDIPSVSGPDENVDRQHGALHTLDHADDLRQRES